LTVTLILTSDEQDLRETVRRFAAERSPVARLRERTGSGVAYDADVWKQMSAQLGLPGLIIPAACGGAEAGYSALSVAFTELGAGLVASPLLAVTLAAAAILRLGGEAGRDLLPPVASGELIVTLAALADTGTVTVAGDPATSDQVTVTGQLEPVLNGAQAGVLLVPARVGAQTALLAVAAGADGLTAVPLTSIDPSRSLARIELSSTPARVLSADAHDALAFAADLANLVLAAEQCGGMAAVLAMTADYAKLRVAFGQPIGAFQGVKHRLANIATARELAYAALRDAATAADDRPQEFSAAASVARVMASPQYLEAATAAIQLHGGIGFTWEHDAHFYYKNAVAGRVLLGGPGEQLDRLRATLTV
jgi:alkylation response protein AidB-like acyl-CoA dehydrogenase